MKGWGKKQSCRIFRCHSGFSLDRPRKTIEILKKNRQSLDLNPKTPEYEAEVWPLDCGFWVQASVTQIIVC